MAGPVKRALVEMGYRVREYCPVGELLPGMSYLVRRLLENTSNEGFLRAKFSENVSEDQLLRDPADLVSQGPNGARRIEINGDHASLDTPPGDTYENAPLVNFAYEQNQERMRAAIEHARTQLGQKYPIVINGEKIWTDNTIASINPSNPDQVVGHVAEARIPEAERPVKIPRETFDKWSRTSFESRFRFLERR